MPRMMPAIVFYALDTAATRRFYEALGLAFVEEKHGDGPVHYACDFQGIALEIYPLARGKSANPCNTVALIFFVDAFDRVLNGLEAIGAKPGHVVLGHHGLREVNIHDPEGLLVRLLENGPTLTQ